MKSIFRLIMIVLLLGAGAAQALPIVYTATLTGLAENPSNASPGIGTASVTYDSDLHTLGIEVIFSDLIGTTTVAHIHCCIDPPGNAGVATTTPSFTGFPLGVTSGSYSVLLDLTLASSFNSSFVNNNGGTLLDAETALATGIDGGRAYFNIHTTMYGAGEIRGFLAAVPEPTTWWLLGIGLAALVSSRRMVKARAMTLFVRARSQ
ncbi:MAG: CHRD domain-containing protein [Xanthomonadaceae bacterium]|nr:CHRD domain-containing protein [Xanthomonadaceae bacterium]